MNINKENYEALFFELVEGNLTKEQEAEVLAFAEAHPDMKRELEMFRMSFLEPEKEVVFLGKDALKKKGGVVISLWQKRWLYAAAAMFALFVVFKWMVKDESVLPLATNQPEVKSEPAKAVDSTEAKQPEVLPLPDSKQIPLTVAPHKTVASRGAGSAGKQQTKMAVDSAPLPAPVKENTPPVELAYDTAAVRNKKDAIQKLNDKLNKELLAHESPETDSLPGVQTQTNALAMQQPDTSREKETIKEKVFARIENVLAYFSKPQIKMDKVSVDNKTHYMLHIENEKLKLSTPIAGL